MNRMFFELIYQQTDTHTDLYNQLIFRPQYNCLISKLYDYIIYIVPKLKKTYAKDYTSCSAHVYKHCYFSETLNKT